MRERDHQINLEGATATRMGCVSPPLSLIKNRTDDFGASLTLLGRKYLQPSSHVLAGKDALCGIPSHVFLLSQGEQESPCAEIRQREKHPVEIYFRLPGCFSPYQFLTA